MKVYIDILLVALVTIYIVDLSGFTESWRGLVASALRVKALKPLPPFDCGQCMTWWACITCAAVLHSFALATVAFSALLSFLSVPIGQLLIFIREGLIAITNKLTGLL